ncbi:MAG TPA: S8 family serine peptidase [Puia sp.]|nr:S8 family serine peptidase [Puia sp.]
MATYKPHIKLNTDRQQEPSATLKYNYGFGKEDDEEEEEEKNYVPMAQAFRGYLDRFGVDEQNRVSERNESLAVPLHIEYIQILFQSQFVVSTFYQQWMNEFGLLGVRFSQFNHEVLFAISDRDKFEGFFRHIENFIEKELGTRPEAEYSNKVTYIKEFQLLSSADMLKFSNIGELMNIQLVDDLSLGSGVFNAIYDSLEAYLSRNQIGFSFSTDTHNLEVHNATQQQILDVVRNFDIVLQVTSSLATLISPSAFNQPERSYGFTISNRDETLPIIGIIDTGISAETPLSPILIQDDRFNLTQTSPFIDEANHGTATAALVALGKRPYGSSYQGPIKADARLLSIKVMDDNSRFLSQREVVNLLYRVKEAYPEIKIMVLTICYNAFKLDNEDHSAYAYELDKFAHQTGCYIHICTANNNEAAVQNTKYDLHYFAREEANICPPAESMNNMTVGAAADSLRDGHFQGISIDKEFPALYSRKGHMDLVRLYPKNKINKLYFKPDVIDCGGDYEYSGSGRFIGTGPKASMQVLSADPAESFYPNVGTSFSAPLVANIAAQIQKVYPDIRAQSIKALIVNAASLNLIRFEKPFKNLLNKTAGHGLTSDAKSIFSTENAITFLLEESIEPENIRIFPLHFPEYLTRDDLGKKEGFVKITATLCFSFAPVLHQHLAYCPIHIGFCFFRNQSANEIQEKEAATNSLLKSNLRWSQSARHVQKPIPYSNTQKISFVVSKQLLEEETSTFKLAVNCRINPQLLPGTEGPYQRAHPFSIVLTVEENLKKSKLTGQLYNEMILCNEVENIAAADLEADQNEATV